MYIFFRWKYILDYNIKHEYINLNELLNVIFLLLMNFLPFFLF